MNKLVKVLIIINGFLLPILIIFIFYQILDSTHSPTMEEEEDGIIVGEQLDKAKSDSLALQGLYFDTPKKLYNSENFYLPIDVMTYGEAKQLGLMKSSANDYSYSYNHTMNVVFLDKNYKVIKKLLDRKASIREIKTLEPSVYRNKIDTTVKNIAYLIGFEDSNKDGKINNYDYHDLFISDLDGTNLIQATKNINIISFKFINSNSEILIRYKDRSELKEEHKRMNFGIFNIESSKYKDLTSLNSTLKDLEDGLIK